MKVVVINQGKQRCQEIKDVESINIITESTNISYLIIKVRNVEQRIYPIEKNYAFEILE